MKQSQILSTTFYLMLLALVSCGPTLSEESQPIPESTAVVTITTTASATPTQAATAMATGAVSTPAIATGAPTGTSLPTRSVFEGTAEIPGTAATALPASDVILIYGIRSGTTEPSLSATRSPQQYEADVISAVVADLAGRLGLPETAVAVTATRAIELPAGSPCGATSTREETGPAATGIRIGHEVILAADGSAYRYVAQGGLAYYCGPS